MELTSVLLHNLTIVDAVGTDAVAGAVWVRDGIILAVGTEAEVRAQADDAAVAIDLGGAYLAPGLINMHTHFSLALPGERGDYVSSLDAHGIALYMADGARRALHSGITTVRCVAERDHADFALRDAIQRGLVPGPDIYTAGQALVCTGGHGHETSDTVECDGADDFARGVRTQLKAGADLIKVMISGGIAGEHESIDTPQLTRAEMEAVITTAHAWGRKVTAHAGPASVIAEAVELGLDCVEHGYQLTPEVARAMAAAGTALVPTLIVTRCGSFFDELGVPAWMQERSLAAGPRHVESFR
ncbi:MAG: amidohydrolase family protein, partial [Actinomycetota bacterium]|nr:amidohydrolase family protein [Actinomycetota bacterium]